MKEFPLITVYIPTHNRCKLLERAIASVMRQTYQNLEVIIVNDASIDGTKNYLDELINHHTNIRVFHMANASGACVARNIAIKNAHGSLITGLDDDDEFLPERLEILVGEFDQKYAFICTGFIWDYGKKSRKLDNRAKIISLEEQFNYNYATNQVLVSTEKLRTIGGFDEAFVACQDYDTWTRLIQKFGPAKRVAGASYVIHRGDQVTRISASENWLKGHTQFLDKFRLHMSQKNIINQNFKRISAKKETYHLSTFLKQSRAGLFHQKFRYFLSSNFKVLGELRRRLIE